MLLAATLLLWNASCMYIYIYISISLSSHHSLSFFNPHSSKIESLILYPFYELEIESKLNGFNFPSAPARASMVVRGPAYLSIFFVSNSTLLRFDTNAMARFFELAAGFDLAPFRKNDVHSSPRPRRLGLLPIICLMPILKILASSLRFDSTHYLPPIGAVVIVLI